MAGHFRGINLSQILQIDGNLQIVSPQTFYYCQAHGSQSMVINGNVSIIATVN